MAKGRKLTTSRSELFFGAYSYSHSAVSDPSELREEDIWSVADGDGDDDHEGVNATNGEWEPRASSQSNGRSFSVRNRHRISSDNHNRQVGGLSLAFDDPAENGTVAPPAARIVHQFRSQNDAVGSPRGRHVASSAPVNVPDWSKILRVQSVESIYNGDDGLDDDDESDMVPPHEYLARSRNAAATSVFEGVGRTLKGRDMSRVRDAVWSQTGFNG